MQWRRKLNGKRRGGEGKEEAEKNMVKMMRQAAFMDSWSRPKTQVNLDADIRGQSGLD